MKFLGFDKVLCISPHPDDVEYSMAGTVLKCTDTHFDVVTLTNGGDFDETNKQPRNQEVDTFWKDVPNVTSIYTGIDKIKTLDEAAWVNLLETEYLTDHDAIVTTNTHDSHFEHRIVSEFGYALSRIKPISLLEYMSPSTQRSWQPNIFVDIGKQLDEKKTRLKQFKSQQDRSYFMNTQINGFHTEFQCSKKGIIYVEQFNLKQDFII